MQRFTLRTFLLVIITIPYCNIWAMSNYLPNDSTPSPPSCCPPGSLGAPPSVPSFSEKTKGALLTLGPTDTPCYYVGPPTSSSSSSSSSSTSGLVLYPDVWGMKSRILHIADWLAQQGNFHVVVCDSFRGETRDDHGNDLAGWFRSVPYDPVVAQDTAACRDYLQTQCGVQKTSLGAMGFCWGAWAIGKTSCADHGATTGDDDTDAWWSAVVGAHPSFKIESFFFSGDDIALMQGISCPLLILAAGNDPSYTKPESPEFQVISTQRPSSKSLCFDAMKHGWMTRGDLTDPALKRDVEAGLQATLQFFREHMD